MEWAKRGMVGVVNDLLEWRDDAVMFPAPACAQPDPEIYEVRRQLRQLSEEERQKKVKELVRRAREQTRELKSWWLRRMAQSPHPLQEKLTLFWHGHFATSIRKVRSPHYMWRQNDLFRRMGAGRFRDLLLEVGRDPAMLIWLDGAQSRREAPNENYARELLELFTLGEGHYGEDDIRTAAQAFTGWSLDPRKQQAVFRPRQHAPGRGKFLGQEGVWNDEAIVDAVVRQPQCARWITGKLWTFFAGSSPEPQVAAALADVFMAHDGEIRPILRAILGSAAFYSPKVMMAQIKSPVEWLFGLQSGLNIRDWPEALSFPVLEQLGQDLFTPPSVKGWDGGRAWISTTTLFLRQNIAKLLIHGGDVGKVLGEGEVLRRLRAQQQSPSQEQAMMGEDPEGQRLIRRQQRVAERARHLAPRVKPADLITAEGRHDAARAVDGLLRRLVLTPSRTLREVTLQRAQEMPLPLSDHAICELLDRITTHPEYQLL